MKGEARTDTSQQVVNSIVGIIVASIWKLNVTALKYFGINYQIESV